MLEELWRSAGGALEECWRALEEGWRSSGGALEERWRSAGELWRRSGGALEELWRSFGAVEASQILTNVSHSGAPKPDFDECFAFWSSKAGFGFPPLRFPPLRMISSKSREYLRIVESSSI